MTESIRFHMEDSLFALLVAYCATGSRDITTAFGPLVNRSITVDNVTVPIVKKVLSEMHEIPGINLVFSDEFTHIQMNPAYYRVTIGVHVYLECSNNVSADARTLKKIQSLIDSAMLDGSVGVYDLTANPSIFLNSVLQWVLLGTTPEWRDLTNLQTEGFLHKSKNWEAFYRDSVLV